jgi:hypothetical protein
MQGKEERQTIYMDTIAIKIPLFQTYKWFGDKV